MIKKWILCFFVSLGATTINAQLKSTDSLAMRGIEDSMQETSAALRDAINLKDRLYNDSLFTKQLVRALKTSYSIHFPFDSLISCSKLMSPDSSFRIFTWQLQINEDYYKQRGAIQMRTADGTLKLFPLTDKSENIDKPEDFVGSHNNWIGAIYYKILKHTYNQKDYYTLIGYDENSIRSNKKMIEVMRFEDGAPVFGGPYFMVPNDQIIPHFPNRFIMEYKKSAGVRLNYDNDLGMIIKEHLISETNEPNRKWTMIGDGDYEGFVWKKGKWVYVEKVFDQKTPEGKAPVPQPLNKEAKQ